MKNSVSGKILGGLSNYLKIDVPYFVKGGFWLGVGYAGSALLRLLQIVILARVIDRQEYGVYQFVLVSIAVVAVFSLPGMDGAVVRSVANGYDSSFVSGTKAKLKWALIGSLVLFGMAMFFKFFQPRPFWHIFIFVALLFPCYTGFSGIPAYYRGKEKFRTAALYDLLVAGVSTFAIFVALFLEKSVFAVIISLMIFNILVYFFVYFKTCKQISSYPVDRAVVREGIHYTVIGALSYLTPYADKFIIAFVVGFEGLAVYAVAVSLLLNLSIGSSLISTLLLPKLSRAKPHHAERIKGLFWLACFCIAGLVLAVILLTPWLLPFLFSVKYVESVRYAQIALVSLVFLLPSSILVTFFRARNRVKFLYVYALGMGIMNIVLLGIGVPLLGIFGAVLSKVVLSFLGCAFLAVWFFATTNIKSSE